MRPSEAKRSWRSMWRRPQVVNASFSCQATTYLRKPLGRQLGWLKMRATWMIEERAPDAKITITRSRLKRKKRCCKKVAIRRMTIQMRS